MQPAVPDATVRPDNLRIFGRGAGRERAGELRIFTRFEDRQVKLIAGGARTAQGGRLFDVAFFDDQAAATAAAATCIVFLERIAENKGSPAAGARDGWYDLPADVSPQLAISRLLAAARNAVWAGEVPAAAAPLPDDAAPTSTDHVSAPPPKRDRTRARRVWTHERDRALVELMLTGHTAKEVADDPRFREAHITPEAIYTHASACGLSFRDSPQITVRDLPFSVLAVLDRAAGAGHKSRDGFVRTWIMRAAADPARFGLVAVAD